MPMCSDHAAWFQVVVPYLHPFQSESPDFADWTVENLAGQFPWPDLQHAWCHFFWFYPCLWLLQSQDMWRGCLYPSGRSSCFPRRSSKERDLAGASHRWQPTQQPHIEPGVRHLLPESTPLSRQWHKKLRWSNTVKARDVQGSLLERLDTMLLHDLRCLGAGCFPRCSFKGVQSPDAPQRL